MYLLGPAVPGSLAVLVFLEIQAGRLVLEVLGDLKDLLIPVVPVPLAGLSPQEFLLLPGIPGVLPTPAVLVAQHCPAVQAHLKTRIPC